MSASHDHSMEAVRAPAGGVDWEEVACGIIQGCGIVLSIAALAILVALAHARADGLSVAAMAIYGTTLILLYTASTLYHSVTQPRVKAVLRVLDHSAIFLLIAGTYTPFTLLALRGRWGWTLFAVIWGLALLGITLSALRLRRRGFVIALYVAMGWAGLVAIMPLREALAGDGLRLMLAGGLCYTLGVPIYLWKRLPFHHALWHLFVMAGSVFMFCAVLLYILPPG